MNPEIVLGGLVGAILGSLLSLAGAYGLERRKSANRRRAAARALWCETTLIETQLGFFMEGKDPGEFSDLTWRSVITDIAMLVSESELKLLNVCYGSLGFLRGAVVEAKRTNAGPAQLVAEWQDAAKDWEKASYLLKLHGFNMNERVRIHDAQL